jgi:1-acyl-sn-glycerol-3-phosphate acyltransferase
MNFNTIKQGLYGLYLTNSFGLRLTRSKNATETKKLRLGYSVKQLEALKISLCIENKEKLPKEGQYLVIINHRSIIDPPIVEVALKDTDIFGPWISKKELYNSFFFGLFVRNAGSILLDRDKNKMSGFFGDIKQAVKRGESIFIFPEGTRNKSDEPLKEFKKGSRIIALKNRLPILPLYIESHSQNALSSALIDKNIKQEIKIVVGDIISYRDKKELELAYREIFKL